MLLRIAIALLILIGSSSYSISQDHSDIPAEITAATEGFLTRIQNKDTEGAWHFLWDGTSNLSQQSLQSGIAETNVNINTYGPISKWKIIEHKSIEESTFRITYYVQLREIPLFFRFFYYKVDDKWKIVHISIITASDASKAGMFDIK